MINSKSCTVIVPEDIDWTTVPGRYQYATRDSVGVVRVHEREPVMGGDNGDSAVYCTPECTRWATIFKMWTAERPKPKVVSGRSPLTRGN